MQRMTVKLGPRLEAVASFLPPGVRVADVGTDHGLLPAWLSLNERASVIIASDIRPGPLDAAERTARRLGAKGIDFRLCPGLSGIRREEADVVVIAGMGGETAASIVEESGWSWQGKRLVLQPNTKSAELLRRLYAAGLHLRDEAIAVERSRPYRVLCVEWGPEPPLPRAFLWGGLRDSAFARRQAALLRGAMGSLEASGAPEDRLRLREYREILEEMKDVYHWGDSGLSFPESAEGDGPEL